MVVSSLLDIDECRERSDLCKNGGCRNLAGTYICDCDSGYVRSADGKECEGKQKRSVIFFRLLKKTILKERLWLFRFSYFRQLDRI